MPRLTKIYTRKGDKGYTTLRNQTLAKDDLLVELVGVIDELNAAIGIILATSHIPSDVNSALLQIQNDLFEMGAELHVPERNIITAEKVTWLEEQLDHWNKNLPSLEEFILPGGNLSAAITHLARTICRRAERTMVRLHRHTALNNTESLRYLNRLSDLLFVIARVLARADNKEEKMWEHN